MLIKKEKTKYHEYALSFEYCRDVVDFCQYLKSIFGWTEFQYDLEKKKWRFKDLLIANMLKSKFTNLQLEKEVEKDIEMFLKKKEEEKEKEQNAIRIKEAKISNLEIKGIKGELRDYQKEGVKFFIDSNGRALLCDEMGTGKTLQSLAYIVGQGFKRTLVITPASVKFVWEAEAAKFTNLKTFVVDSKTDLTLVPHDIPIVIINYDILKRFHNELLKYQWDALICDEAHFCKAQSSLRSKIVRLLSRNIPHILLLTGTPILSRSIEIYNLLNMIDPKVWCNWYSFAVKYAGGKQGYFGFEARGSTNLEELKQRISKYFLRRTKKDVLSQLPPKNRIDIPIELPKEDREAYDLIESNLIKYLRECRNKTDKEIAKTLAGEKLVKLNLLREVNSIGKIKTAKEIIDGIISAEEKIIVFSSFNSPLIKLSAYFKEESVLLLGSTPIKERQELVRQFQENPKIKIFFSGIKSGGIGITLTKATNVLFLDRSWNPADHSQAEDRMHRLGQVAQSVNIYTITSRNTIDDFMVKLLKFKQEIIDQLIEGKDVEKEDKLINNYLKELELKYKE